MLDSSFSGVLVSDFYAAYNHYPGLKQRCWAHLLRDIHDLKGLYPRAQWAEAVDPLSLDGKTLRGVHGQEIPGVHLVSAYASRAGAVLAQVAAPGKGEELAAVKEVLGQVPLKGRVVVADALLTQRKVCEQIVAGGGEYLLPVKENQPTLRRDLEVAFSPARN